jgi:hypothetical protein
MGPNNSTITGSSSAIGAAGSESVDRGQSIDDLIGQVLG